ncbi:MAG TPA: ABC transporter permease [Geodermatophilus sp.]|nr:ABC transporter permease [Geodermatophilus sp.]
MMSAPAALRRRTAPTGDGPPGPPSRLGRLNGATSQYVGVLAVLALLVVVLGATQPQFLTVQNFVNIADQNAVLLTVAVGMTFVLLAGGIDLSVGGVLALTSVVLWQLLTTGMSPPLAITLAVAVAFLLGFAVNGILIGWVGLSFLVVTIGTAYVFRGLAQVWTGGQSQSIYQTQYLVDLGAARWLGVPAGVVIAAAVFVLALLVLRYTGYGRMLYAVGGNAEAARLAGINVTFVRVSVFGISAGLAGLAAVMDTARLTTASPVAGSGYELLAGAAVLLGGTSFMGGRGSVFGTLLGVLFLGVLQNGLTLAGISPFWASVASGVVLIAAVLVDRLRNGVMRS